MLIGFGSPQQKEQILEAFSTACIETHFDPTNAYWRGVKDALRAVLEGRHPAPPKVRAA
jgi:hypothetical protein